METFIAHWVIDYPYQGRIRICICQGDTNGIVGNTVSKISRTSYAVNSPSILRVGEVLCTFFTHNAKIGIEFLEMFDDKMLGFEVSFSDKINIAGFGRHFNRAIK